MTDRAAPADDLAAVAALAEPLRREIFRFVAGQPEPMGRDAVAEHVGAARSVAAFHLDKLAGLGLLEVEYRRPPGRSGPGAGRPAKLYRATGADVAVSVPPREYELAGRLLAHAVTASRRDGVPVDEALTAAAAALGRRLGRHVDGDGDGDGVMASACAVLRGCAYEPVAEGPDIVLGNCPFHALAEDYRDVVCGMNLALMSGLVEELGDETVGARLDPAPGRCCVRLTRRAG